MQSMEMGRMNIRGKECNQCKLMQCVLGESNAINGD